MSVVTLRDEYVARFAAIDGVREARAHDQDWNDAELARVGVRQTPTVLVTAMGFDSVEVRNGTVVADYRWAAIVIARNKDAVVEGESSGGDVAGLLAARVARELAADGFSAACGRAHGIDAGNVSTAARAKAGNLTMWAVAWQQAAELEDAAEITLLDLDTIATETDVTGDGVADAVTAAGGPYVVEEDGTTKVLDESGEPIRTETLD